KAVLDGMATLLEEVAKLGLHPGEVVGMDATPPEIRALQILVGLVAQQVLHIVADERRTEIAARLEAVDHGGPGDQHMHEAVLRGTEGFAQVSARRDIAPRTDHLDRIACLIAHELQLIADPAVIAVFLAEAILVGDMPFLEEASHAAQDTVQVLRMNAGL